MSDSEREHSPPEAGRPYAAGLGAIFQVVARLRAPGGCPWDREQTHESLRPYLLEEAYELLEAIDAADDARILEELGDVLLQVAMHAELAAERGAFDAALVSETVAAKMVDRHPHVFGSVSVADADEVLRNWEHRKRAQAAAEGKDESVVDRVPSTLPALAWAWELQRRAARVGLDHAAPPADAEVIAEAARQVAAADSADVAFEEIGDLLFAVVALARRLRVNPEDALRVAAGRFRQRVKDLEAQG